MASSTLNPLPWVTLEKRNFVIELTLRRLNVWDKWQESYAKDSQRNTLIGTDNENGKIFFARYFDHPDDSGWILAMIEAKAFLDHRRAITAFWLSTITQAWGLDMNALMPELHLAAITQRQSLQ